jgi:hypothetical protein
MFRPLYIGHPQVFLKLIELLYKQYVVLWGRGGRDLVYNFGWHESEFLGWSFLYLLQSFVVARLGTLFVCWLSQVCRLQQI